MPNERDAKTTARHIMKGCPPVLRRKASLLSAAELAVSEKLRHIPIVDKRDRVVGVVSLGDLRGVVGDLAGALERRGQRRRMKGIEIRHVMNPDPVLVGPDAGFTLMAELFVKREVGALFVVDAEKKLLGVVSTLDFIQHLASLALRPAPMEARLTNGSAPPPQDASLSTAAA